MFQPKNFWRERAGCEKNSSQTGFRNSRVDQFVEFFIAVFALGSDLESDIVVKSYGRSTKSSFFAFRCLGRRDSQGLSLRICRGGQCGQNAVSFAKIGRVGEKLFTSTALLALWRSLTAISIRSNGVYGLSVAPPLESMRNAILWHRVCSIRTCWWKVMGKIRKGIKVVVLRNEKRDDRKSPKPYIDPEFKCESDSGLRLDFRPIFGKLQRKNRFRTVQDHYGSTKAPISNNWPLSFGEHLCVVSTHCSFASFGRLQVEIWLVKARWWLATILRVYKCRIRDSPSRGIERVKEGGSKTFSFAKIGHFGGELQAVQGNCSFPTGVTSHCVGPVRYIPLLPRHLCP